MSELLTIDELLDQLRPDYSNLNVPKICFLEGENRLHPVRGDDGRLRYSPAEVTAAIPTPDW